MPELDASIRAWHEHTNQVTADFIEKSKRRIELSHDPTATTGQLAKAETDVQAAFEKVMRATQGEGFVAPLGYHALPSLKFAKSEDAEGV